MYKIPQIVLEMDCPANLISETALFSMLADPNIPAEKTYSAYNMYLSSNYYLNSSIIT